MCPYHRCPSATVPAGLIFHHSRVGEASILRAASDVDDFLLFQLRGILGPWGQLHQRSDLPEAASPVDTAHSIIPYRCIP